MIRKLMLPALLLMACPAYAADDQGHAHASEEGTHLTTFGDIRIVHAWTRATGRSEALVFMEIEHKGGKAATLTGGTTGIADGVTLVAFQSKDGTAGYVALPDLTIAPGAEMVLQPEGVALLLTGLDAPLVEDESFGMEVEFARGHADVIVQIEASNATRHSHAGHAH
jgi:copper(I)-binding protein